MPETFLFGRLASSAMQNASVSAFTLSSNFVDPEHLLHAMMLEERGIAVKVLKEYWIDPEKVRKEIESGKKVRAPSPDNTELMTSARTYNVLVKAKENCKEDGREIILTGDLLVGMLAENGNKAAQTLHRLGITRDYLDVIRDEVNDKSTFSRAEILG